MPGGRSDELAVVEAIFGRRGRAGVNGCRGFGGARAHASRFGRQLALFGPWCIEPWRRGVEVAGRRRAGLLARWRLRWCGRRIWLCGRLVRRGRQVGARRLVAHRFLDGCGRLCGSRLAYPRLLVVGSGLLRTGKVCGNHRWRRRPAAEGGESGGGLTWVAGRQRIAALPAVFRMRRTIRTRVWTVAGRRSLSRVPVLRAALGFGSRKGVRALEATRSTVQFETGTGQFACRRTRALAGVLGLLVLTFASAESALFPARGFGTLRLRRTLGTSTPRRRFIDEVVVWQVLYGRFVAAGDIALGKPRGQHGEAVVITAHDSASLALSCAVPEGAVLIRSLRSLTRPP